MKFTWTDFEGEPISQYTHEDVSRSTSCDEQKQLFLQGMQELVKKLDSMNIELETISVDELEHKLNIVKRCIKSLNESYTFDRHSTISLPSRWSIYSIQKDVRQTHISHEKQHESQIQKEPQSSQPRPKPTRPIHELLSRPKQKRVVFPSIPRVTCEIYYTLTKIESGETSATCKNCHAILKLK